MKERKQEFLSILCEIYLIFLFAVLPLYVGEGYYLLGDVKYLLFRNVTAFTLAVWLAVESVAGACMLAGRIREGKEHMGHVQTSGSAIARLTKYPSFWVAALGVVSLISAVLSDYPRTAWFGYQDWHMGALMWTLLVGMYLFVARYGHLTGPAFAIVLPAACTVVTGIGLLQKLSIDPLGLLTAYTAGDWEYGHMLSTLGNIDWLAGYYSVCFAVLVARYLTEERKLVKSLLLLASGLAAVLLLIQGSDSGILVLCVVVLVGLLASLRRQKLFEDLLLLLAVVGLLMFGMLLLIDWCGTRDTLATDGYAQLLLGSLWWLPMSVLAMTLRMVSSRLPEPSGDKLRLGTGIVAGVGAGIFILAGLCALTQTPFAEWGNYRGTLWQMSLEDFAQATPLRKFIGCGPDCFAEDMAQLYEGGSVLFATGRFAGSVFANAHNEWLTMLVNLGISGVLCYGAFFVTAFLRHVGKERTRKHRLVAVLTLFSYGALSVVGFVQVLGIPFLFAVLGLCEAEASQTGEKRL